MRLDRDILSLQAGCISLKIFFFFLNDPATPDIYPFPLHDALPILAGQGPRAPSKSRRPAATATLSVSAPCARGIATRCAATALSCGRIPAPSFPTMTAIGPPFPDR